MPLEPTPRDRERVRATQLRHLERKRAGTSRRRVMLTAEPLLDFLASHPCSSLQPNDRRALARVRLTGRIEASFADRVVADRLERPDLALTWWDSDGPEGVSGATRDG